MTNKLVVKSNVLIKLVDVWDILRELDMYYIGRKIEIIHKRLWCIKL